MCRLDVDENNPVEVECPICDGSGCSECDEGYMVVKTCPRQFVGHDLTQDINIIACCRDGILPVSGGLLNQSAWFVNLKQALDSDEVKIQRENRKRLD